MNRGQFAVMAFAVILLLPDCAQSADAVQPAKIQVRDLVADAANVALDVPDDAPAPARETRPCIPVRGLLDDPHSSLGERLLDFTLERQEFAKKPETLEDSEWKVVSVDTAIEILDLVTDYQEEVVPEVNTKPVITMPLPQLSDRGWYAIVSHPELQKKKAAKETTKGLLLFRYIDFDVKSGHWYRYRVRLGLKAQRPDTLSDLEWSRWSEPTKVVEVKPSGMSAKK